MHINSKRAVIKSRDRQRGFTLLQVIVIVALISIVTVFGAMGVVNARARMRLTGSARTFAGLAEKARADSVRRHAMAGTMASMQLLSVSTYSVTMDFDDNGVLDAYDTKTFTLDTNVAFDSRFVGTVITFDWRGRSITGQVNPVLLLTGPATGAALVTISGSGDITLDSESFPDGSIPDVVLNGAPGGDIRPDPPPNPQPMGSTSPTPYPTATPTPDPNATPTPTPTPTPEPTPTPCGNNGINCRPSPSPTATPTPTPVASPSPSPSPAQACTLTASPSIVTFVNKGTVSIYLTVANSSGSTTVSLSGNTNTSHISVSLAPGQTGVVNGSGTVSFIATMNGNNQTGTLYFTAGSPCGKSTYVSVIQ